MLRANYDYPFVKFAMTDDDRPMLMTELPPVDLDREALGPHLVRLTIVADRLLDETAAAVADRGSLPDWSGRTPGMRRCWRPIETRSRRACRPGSPHRPVPVGAACSSD